MGRNKDRKVIEVMVSLGEGKKDVLREEERGRGR